MGASRERERDTNTHTHETFRGFSRTYSSKDKGNAPDDVFVLSMVQSRWQRRRVSCSSSLGGTRHSTCYAGFLSVDGACVAKPCSSMYCGEMDAAFRLLAEHFVPQAQ